MKTSYFLLAVLLISAHAWADGLPLSEGRYTGAVLVFNLTEAQKKVIDHYRTCQLDNSRTMNVYTPYVFTLSANQSKELKEKKGFAPKYFAVYETFRGFNDAGPHWNLALRISEDEIEIPLDLIVTNKEAKAEHNGQGWLRNNPCFPNLGRQ